MQLQVKAQHGTVPDAVRSYAEKRLSKLSRRLYEGTLVEVTFSREHNPSIRDDHVAEGVVFTKGPNLVARESATTYEAAVDQLVDKLERQIERYRDKRVREPRRAAQRDGCEAASPRRGRGGVAACHSIRVASGSRPASLGCQRQREWDAVATADGDGTPGDEVEFVALDDGSFVLESDGGADPAPFAAALGDSIATPYRALAVKRPEVWAVGAVAIEVDRLEPDPRGAELELTWNGSELELTIDDLPADPSRAAALERLAVERVDGAYAAHAHRLRGDLWELSVLPL